jgi:hypothetical protein
MSEGYHYSFGFEIYHCLKREERFKINVLAYPLANIKDKKLEFVHTPSISKYKQNLLFRFIHLMMYVVHMDHIHH